MSIEPERRALITSLIAKWQPRLCLRDFDIRVGTDEPAAGRRGESHHWPEKNAAVVCIAPTAPDSEIERIVVHEMLHVLMQQVVSTFESAKGCASPGAAAELHERWEMAEEQMIEKLTIALVGQPVAVWTGTDCDPHFITAFAAPI